MAIHKGKADALPHLPGWSGYLASDLSTGMQVSANE
jgi:hypothetical protein